MLDPGRYFAEAIYFLQYTLAQILWTVNRATLSIAVIAESVNSWVTDNVGYFVQLLVNALSAPLGGMFILALTALGFWYTLNNIVPTGRWVDPSKLFTYGLIAFFFFSSPIVVIDLMEQLRQALNAGMDQALVDGAAGDIFNAGMDGTDPGLPGAIPDINSDGVIGSFDLVAAFMLVANLDELDNTEFPLDFQATYFPFGDPTTINLADEADRQLAKALASLGIERLLFALVAVPTAIAEHFLRLALTGVAMFLYVGIPLAMLFAFFVYTQAFLGAYLQQFINLLIETFMSVIIAGLMVGLLAAAAQQGTGLYIGASLITLIVLAWRIKSALRLAAAAFNLFGGGVMTGGEGGMGLVTMGKQAVTGAVGLAGAALTGGATLAVGGTVLAGAAALQADGRAGGAYLNTDPAKTEGRVQQLKTMAGYALGKTETTRQVIETAHEARTLARNFRDGEVQPHSPDMLDYLRAGSSMSGFGSSPWLAMRLSPSLRMAYDQIGGRAHRAGFQGRSLDDTVDSDGEPVSLPAGPNPTGRRRAAGLAADPDAPWRAEPATSRQLAYLEHLGVDAPADISRGQASDLISQARSSSGAAGATAADAPGGGEPNRPAQAANPDLLNRFTSLEQAITGLTQALTGTEAAGRPGEGGAPAVRDVRVAAVAPDLDGNGIADREEVRNVNLVRAHPDLDRDGREDKLETNRPVADGSSLPEPPVQPEPAAPIEPSVRLEPYQDSRRQMIDDTLTHLADPDSLPGQAAYKTLVVYTGERNAALIQAAVAEHSAPAVQTATAATADLVTQYRTEGLGDAAVLAAFQGGQAAAAIREATATPLTEGQLAAVADMVMLPQRRLTRAELAAVIGQVVAAGATGEEAVSQAVNMPISFGGQTGNVRGVMAGARAMRLTPEELARLAEMIQEGLREAAQTELVARGYRPETVQDFVSDLAALPATLVVPQTSAPLTGEEE